MFWRKDQPNVVNTGRRNQNFVAEVALQEKKIKFWKKKIYIYI